MPVCGQLLDVNIEQWEYSRIAEAVDNIGDGDSFCLVGEIGAMSNVEQARRHHKE